jgi:carboxyl-terminal processing protease
MKPISRRRVFAAVAIAGAISLSLVFAASISSSAYRYLNVFQEVWGLTRSNYVEPVDENALLDGAFRGMAGSLDGTSAYLAPGEDKAVTAAPGPGRPGMETLPSAGAAVIVRVDPGGPAARAGLDVGDQVWKIGGRSMRQQPWPLAKRRLAGQVGGKLDLTILDGKTFKLREVKVDLEAPASPGYLLEKRDGPVVYLRLYDPDFVDTRTLSKDLAQKLDEDQKAPLLVDLRGTVGLDVQTMSKLGGVFFPGEQLLKLVPRSGSDEVVTATDGKPLPLHRPVFALMDGTTGGTGEAFAALLKNKSDATLLGRATYGLGGIPEVIPLTHGGSLLLTSREFRTIAGVRWSEKGLEPDKLIPPQTVRAGADEKRDYLLEDALKVVRDRKATG